MLAGFEQFLVGAYFLDLPLGDDDDPICCLDRRQPMSNHEAGAALQQATESLLNQAFGFGVDRGCRFVHHEQPGAFQDSPCEGN